MARRVYVRNPRVKGGGYWRSMRISQEGQVVGSGKRRRVKGTPAQESARGARNARQQGVQRGSRGGARGKIHDLGGGVAVHHLSKSTVHSRDLPRFMVSYPHPSRKGRRLYRMESTERAALSYARSKTRGRNTGDKQPRSTKPPKSRKPKKSGALTPGQKAVIKKVKARDRQTGREVKQVVRSLSKQGKATKGTVKKVQGKKRTLSEAQKAAKRTRAKARRARK